MAIKKNKQREKLEQSRASSSSRAHQLLLANAGSNVASPSTFIGFAGFAQPVTPKASALSTKSAVQTIYDGSDREIALALKMLAKKGTVTKNKALQTFLTDVLPPRQPAEIRPMLGHFTQLYTFEMRDQNDCKVRQLLNEVLAALANKMRPRAFVPHLQRLLPYWYLAMHDAHADVATVAKRAFQALYSDTNMLKDVVEKNVPAMLKEYQIFFATTPDTFEGIPLQPDEKEERYKRCVSAAVLSIDAIIKFYREQGMTDKLLDKEDNCSVASVVSSEKFTRLATASSKHPNFTRDVVRRAMYATFVTLCTSAPSIIATREEHFGKVIVGSLNDKSPANHDAMWNAVLTFLHTFPSVWHSGTKFLNFITGAVYPRLFAQIRHGFYGSGRSSFLTLLPFLSLIPFSVAVDPVSGRSALYTGVLEECWKFLGSKDARFGEPPAITAFFDCITGVFSTFLTDPVDSWLSEHNIELFQHNYVNQFENVFVASLTTTLSSHDLLETGFDLYANRLFKLIICLHVSSDFVVLRKFKDVLIENLHLWVRQAIGLVVAKSSFVPSRVSTLIRMGFNLARDRNEEFTASQWLLTSQDLYNQCLNKIDSLMTKPTLSTAKNLSISQLLEAIDAVCNVYPLSLLISNETDTSAEKHFDSHYRPVLRLLSSWKRSADELSVDKTFHVALKLMRPFFLAAKDKKLFLLQLFQDCDVQLSDMAKASDIIQYGLQFPITEQGNKLWLSCGSWQHRFESELSLYDEVEPEILALKAIWQGKLLDDFVVVSIEGRLDDLDGNEFATLLQACFGSLSNSPVISPDAVVNLCHVAIQKSFENNDAVLVQILTKLCELFVKLSGQLPAELEVIERQLYMQLFHLSARVSYRGEARALWARTVRLSLKKWSAIRIEVFVNELAGYINEFITADLPTGAESFNAKLFASYVKSYVQLGVDQNFFAVSQLVGRLDAINLRCNKNDQKILFYDRILMSLSDICEDELVVDALVEYFMWLASEEEVKAVNLVSKFVNLDVTHALTWVIFYSNDYLRNGVDLVEMVESHMIMEPLYLALNVTSSILDNVLTSIIATHQSKHKRESEELRDVLFLCKNQNAGVISQDVSLLTQEQHSRLDELSITVLSRFSTVAARTNFIQKLIDQNGDWKLECTQNVALSLFSVMYSEGEASDKVISEIKSLLASSNRDATSKYDGVLLAYLQLVTRAAQEEAKLHSAQNGIKRDIIDLLTQEPIILHIQKKILPNSPYVVKVNEWVVITNYVTALAMYLPRATLKFRDAWDTLARLIVMHAIAGKTDTAKFAALKLQKRCSTLSDLKNNKVGEEQVVLGYSNELVSARLALMNLVGAMYNSSPDALQELAAHYREALLSTVLCALSESAEIKTSIVSTYVSVVSPAQSFQLISLWLGIEEVLASAPLALRSTLTIVHDVTYSSRLVLECFGGIETLVSLFSCKRYPLQPMLRVLVYILATLSGSFRLRDNDAKAIDVNADNEAATESALARNLIPKALRSALRAVFSNKKGEKYAANIRMGSRKQKLEEREDIMGKLLLWDIFLQLFPANSSTEGESPSSALVASSLSSYVAQYGMLTNFLNFCSALLSQDQQFVSKIAARDLQDIVLFDLSDLDKKEDEEMWSSHEPSMFQLGTRVFFRTVVRLPAMVRSWWNDECSRATRSWAAKYFEDHITPSVFAAELELIQKASESSSATGASWDADEMTVKGSRVSREITTTYVKDECALEMVVRVPSTYPLRCVEVECTKRIGISEDRWRRWVLQIIRVTSSRDGSLLDAVLLWKHNVDKEFDGVEPCPICYSILNPKNMAMPSLPCKTCNNKYHNSCLYKWFNQSGKNKCPICQQPFC